MKLFLKLSYFYILILCLWSLNSYAVERTVLKYGKLEGQVIVPEGFDPSTVVVQVGAVDKFNQSSEDFYTSPNKSGHFEFKNTFTAGSSAILIFWDRQGLLNKRAQTVYVSKFSSFYTVYLERSSVTSSLAAAFGTGQDFAKAGLCGTITGLTAVETTGAEVFLQDKALKRVYNAKYFDEHNLPNINLNYLSSNGRFCFFNVENNNSYLYSLKLKLNSGNIKTFFVYLPSYTFSSKLEFDAKSALFRPIEMYSWHSSENNYYKFYDENNYISWKSIYNIYFSSSADYSSINYSKKLKNTSVYLPLSDEFLNIDYSLKNDKDNHFFIFQPRSALFSKKLINEISKNFSPGQSYIDKLNPLVLKIFDPKVLKGKNSDNLYPIFNKKTGSVFLNLDTTDYKFDKKNIKITLKNLSGNNISYFMPLKKSLDLKNELTGFFYNIPEGLYELFVSVSSEKSNCNDCTTYNDTEKLLWSSLVESLAGKTQVLSNISENKILIEDKIMSSDILVKNFILNENKSKKFSFDLIPANYISTDNIDLQNINIINNIDFIKANSLIYKIDEHELCYTPLSKIHHDNINMKLYENIDKSILNISKIKVSKKIESDLNIKNKKYKYINNILNFSMSNRIKNVILNWKNNYLNKTEFKDISLVENAL